MAGWASGCAAMLIPAGALRTMLRRKVMSAVCDQGASPLWLVDALGDAFGAVTHWAELPVEALIALGKEGAAIAGDAAAGLWRLAGGTRYTNAQVVQGITLSDGDLRVLVWDPDMPVEILGIGTGSLNHPEYSVLKYVLNDHTEVW